MYAKSGLLFDTRPCRLLSPLACWTQFQLFYKHTHINHTRVLLQVKVGMGSIALYKVARRSMALVNPHQSNRKFVKRIKLKKEIVCK